MRWNLSFAALLVMAVATGAFAQTPPGGGGAGGGGGGVGGGRGGRGNPQQFQQRMLDRLKADLGASDDEWKVLEPKIQKVMDARRGTGGFGGFGRRGGRGGGGFGGGGNDPNAPPPTAVQQKAQDLRTVLDNKDAKPDEIKAALAVYREARAKAREDLTKAQDDLRSVLTTKQEAVLVMAGMLE